MRAAFLTHYFPPEVGAPQTRIDAVTRALAGAGHDVVVHTTFPHYPSGTVLAPYRNRPWSREQRGQVAVLRSAVLPAPNAGFVRRLANHASFGLSALATAPLTGPLDVVVVETPPLFTAAAALPYAAAKRAALVVNVADRWPESAIQLGALTDRRAIALAEGLERAIYRRADLITAPTAGLTAELDELAEARGRCRRTWPVVDLDRFDPSPPASAPGAPLRLLYAGTLGMAQGLEVLLEASRLAGPGVVHTTIAGAGAESEHLAGLLAERRIANVELLGALTPDRIPPLYAGADAAAVLLRDVPLFAGALPTKMFEAMAAGRPVLLCARGEAAELIAEAEAGLVIAPGDARALAAAIRRLQAEPDLRHRLGAGGRRFAQERLGIGRAAAEWAQGLEEAVATRRLRRGSAAAAQADVR